MKKIVPLALVFAFCGIGIVFGQGNPPNYPTQDPMYNISVEMTNISRSVQTMNERMKAFVDKFDKIGGTTFSEKQEKLVLGLQFLVGAEQRLANLQRAQIEFVEKQGITRSRLAQVERDLFPQSIDRSVALEGTTRTEEMRDSKRGALQAERTSLRALMTQIDSNISDTEIALREAQLMVQRLRKTFLPQIEREIFESIN